MINTDNILVDIRPISPRIYSLIGNACNFHMLLSSM